MNKWNKSFFESYLFKCILQVVLFINIKLKIKN